MRERPDYVPWIWTRGRLNRQFWSSPTRMFAWLVVAPFGLLAVTLLQFAVGSTALGVAFAVSTSAATIEALIYAPRALRAARSSEAPSDQAR
jgi:hypothetical protein